MKCIKTLSLVVVFLFLFSSIHAQGWFRSYEDISASFFYHNDMVRTPDGGFVLAGEASFGNGTSDIYILKTNDLGEVQWMNAISEPMVIQVAENIIVSSDGNLVAQVRYGDQNGSNPTIEPGVAMYKFDMAGNVLVEEEFEIGMTTFGRDMVENPSGDFVFVGGLIEPVPPNFLNDKRAILSFDSNLEFQFGKTRDVLTNGLDHEQGTSILNLDGEYLVSGVVNDITTNAPESAYTYIHRVDEEGNTAELIFIDTASVFKLNKMVRGMDSNLVTVYHRTLDEIQLVKLTEQGDIIWDVLINSAGLSAYDMTEVSDGGVAIISKVDADQNLILTKVNSDGETEWEKVLDIPSLGTYYVKIQETFNAGFAISGVHTLLQNGEPRLFLLQTDSNGNFLNSRIEGQLVQDNVDNCSVDVGEPGLSHWIVEATGTSNLFFGTTDSNGYYSIPVDTDDYTVRFLNPGSPFWDICTEETSVAISNIGDTAVVAMAAQPLIDCPVMDVDIHANFLRPCFENWISVAYTNRGTALAEGATLEVELDSYLTPVSANIPYSYTGDVLSFDLGDVEPNQFGQIIIKVDLDCDDLVGTLHYVSASAEPSDFCGNTSLPNGISPFDETCVASIAAYDPNDKTVNPVGEGAEHFVPNDTTLSYLIRFQNTGTDTAFNVYLVDTLSEHLDIGSLRPGASSHPYEWEVYGNGVLRFTFNDILLPDSNVNEALSHGFVSFEIRPRPQLLPGTVIENTAGIIFDFNAPIITNTVFNTIAKSVYQVEGSVSVCEGEEFNGLVILGDTTLQEVVETVWYDSIYVYHIEALPHVSNEVSVSICDGETYLFNGQNLLQSGEYQGVFTAFNGCDSTVALTLEVLPEFSENVSAQICSGESYVFHGQNLTTAGTYEAQLQALNGCDSTVVLTLDVLPVYSEMIEAEICEGESFEFGGQSLNASGVYEYQAMALNGCDSLTTLDLNVLNAPETSFFTEICEGETFPFGGQVLSQTGEYQELFTAFNGCDSTVNLSLSVLPNIEEAVSAQICEGDSYLFGGEELDESGSYQATFTALNGCDSLVNLNLEVLTSLVENLSASICEGETYPFDGQNLSEPGQYEANYVTAFGCDSLVFLDLDVLSLAEENIEADICEGETFDFNGELLSETGEYQSVLTGINGCDSLVNLFLQVETLSQDEISASICDGDVYDFYGELLSASGTYSTNVPNLGTCDSLITLELTVNENIESNVFSNLCEGDTMMFNGEQIFAGGVYEAHLTAENGCDSTVTLTVSTLSVFTSDTTITLSAGTVYGGVPILNDTVFIETYVAQNGCDSTVTVSIDVLTSSFEVEGAVLSASIFPNPFSGVFDLRLNLNRPSLVSISVFDLMGHRICEPINRAMLQTGEHMIPVNADGWASGMYLVHLSTEETNAIIRVVKK